MKKSIFIITALLLLIVSCKKKEKFVEPDYVFAKWTRAIKVLNYQNYKKCEAYPKSEPVFREMYRDSYFADLMVVDIEELNKERVAKDHEGNSFIKRNVSFECIEVKRKNRKPVRLLRGDVDFIKYIDSGREKEGWLMWNRKIIRVER